MRLEIVTRQATVDMLQHLKSVVSDVVQNIAVTPTTGNGIAQDIAGTPASATQGTEVSNLVAIRASSRLRRRPRPRHLLSRLEPPASRPRALPRFDARVSRSRRGINSNLVPSPRRAASRPIARLRRRSRRASSRVRGGRFARLPRVVVLASRARTRREMRRRDDRARRPAGAPRRRRR